MKKYFLLIFLFLITLFLGREFFTTNNNHFQIFAEKDYLLMRSISGNIWGYGNIESSSAQNLKQTIMPYFSQKKITDIFSLTEGSEYIDGKMKISKISRNLVHIEIENISFLFFTEDFGDQDQEKLVQSSLSAETDWHAMNKNIVLNFLPQPRKGILYISERNPSPQFQAKSREKNLPLISTKETGGFSLKLSSNNFNLSVRK